MINHVTIKRFTELSGLSRSLIDRYRADGSWLEGQQFIKLGGRVK